MDLLSQDLILDSHIECMLHKMGEIRNGTYSAYRSIIAMFQGSPNSVRSVISRVDNNYLQHSELEDRTIQVLMAL